MTGFNSVNSIGRQCLCKRERVGQNVQLYHTRISNRHGKLLRLTRRTRDVVAVADSVVGMEHRFEQIGSGVQGFH